MDWFNRWRAARHIQHSSYRAALADLPPGLEAAWRHSAPQEFEGIRTDAFFFVRAAEGLMHFFDVVMRSGKPCALPSEAADSVWHAWLRWDPVGLERFCINHFRRSVPHVERAGLASGSLLNTFVACRWLEDGAPGGPRLPALFRLDARLRMRGGHGYWNHMGKIVYARIGAHGRGWGRARPHPELSTHALYMAGMVDRRTLASHLGRKRAADGGSCGGFADGAALAFLDGGASDGCCSDGGGDGGGDAGSGCGSSCGGGGD